MMTSIALALMTVMSSMNPISMAISLMTISILLTPYLYKNLTSSWIPLIMILTFSSGMMTLFMYAASLTSNETNKSKKKIYPMVIMAMTPPLMSQKKTQTSMKSFTSYITMITLAGILMVTLIALTSQAHNPNQTLTSSF